MRLTLRCSKWVFSQKEIEMHASCYISASQPTTAHHLLLSPQEFSNFTARKKHILLVEDNSLLQHLHSLWLKELGYEVTVTGSGEEAIKEISLNYDAVLMDLDLPGDSGIVTTQKILKKINIPIIACTSHLETEMRDTCISAGMIDYLQKPISTEILSHSLNTYLS